MAIRTIAGQPNAVVAREQCTAVFCPTLTNESLTPVSARPHFDRVSAASLSPAGAAEIAFRQCQLSFLA